MLVEDDELILRVAQLLLRSLGCEVVPYPSALEAAATLGAGATDIDVLMTDLTMPEMRGESLVRIARAARPTLPVVVLSGRDIEDPELFADATLRRMPKPFTRADLAAALGVNA
jgi:CheY-like chemotaxis protein